MKNKQQNVATFSLPQWYETGLGEWSVEKILSRLMEYGLEMDEERFKQDTDDCSEPHAVVEKWTKSVKSVSGRGADFFHLSALELWKRLLPDREAFGIIADQLSAQIDRDLGADESPRTEEEVQELMRLLDRLYALTEKRMEQRAEGSIGDFMREIFDHYAFDVGYFLVELPLDLHGHGFTDEAVSVARKFAFVDKSNMLGDLGWIFASSGRCKEALEQVEQNLRDMPDDPWIVIKAGDAYDQCGQPETAVDLYNRALGMPSDRYTRDGAYERLIPLYEQMGKVEEARAVQEQWERYQKESIAEWKPRSLPVEPTRSKKIGRNEPCPCGSGLKYKKCCLNKVMTD